MLPFQYIIKSSNNAIAKIPKVPSPCRSEKYNPVNSPGTENIHVEDEPKNTYIEEKTKKKKKGYMLSLPRHIQSSSLSQNSHDPIYTPSKNMSEYFECQSSHRLNRIPLQTLS